MKRVLPSITPLSLLSTLGLGIGLSLLGIACGDSGSSPGAGGAQAGTPATEAGAQAAGGSGNVGNPGGGAPNPTGGAADPGGGAPNPTGGAADPGGGAPNPTGGAANPGGGAPNPTGGAANPAGGDQGTAGGITTEGLPIPKPKLITSGEGAFWKTDVEPTLGGTTATITVDPANELQDWIGWGGTFNERGWDALMKLDQAQRDNVMKLLFSRVDGLALTWGRIPIGASDYAMSRYTLCDAPCNAENLDTTFSIERDKNAQSGLIPYIKAAQAVVAAEKAQYKGIRDTKFWGSPWTPPPWMKTNNAYDKGVMKNDTTTRKALAKYFVKFIQAYAAEGIPIDHVQPQNEPGWAQAYPSAAWGPFTDDGTPNTSTPAFLGNFVVEDLRPALNEAGLQDVDIWFGTLSNNAHFNAYWGSLADKSAVKGIGLQWETVNSISIPVNAGVTVMQSEHRCGNYPWVSGANNGMNSTAASAEAADSTTFWKDWAPNNYNYGVESWGLFKQWIQGGANSYSAWNMVLDRVGRNLDEARPWPQNALISFNADGSVNVTPYYYAFRHLSQYAEPGGKRIGVTGGDALAFKNPDGSIVVAMFNQGAAAQTTLSIGGTLMQFTIPQRGWATVNYTPSAP